MEGVIRLATPEDAAAIQGIYGPVCADTAISFEMEPPSVEEMRGRIERIGASFPWLVMERGGEVAGYVYAGPHRERAAYRWSTDVTAYVHPRHHRAGVGSTPANVHPLAAATLLPTSAPMRACTESSRVNAATAPSKSPCVAPKAACTTPAPSNPSENTLPAPMWYAPG